MKDSGKDTFTYFQSNFIIAWPNSKAGMTLFVTLVHDTLFVKAFNNAIRTQSACVPKKLRLVSF